MAVTTDSLIQRISLEVPGPVSSEVLRILCLYCCRIIDSGKTKLWLRSVAKPEQVTPLYAIKYALDDSADLNNYWRAVHEVSHFKRPRRKAIKEAAIKHEVPYEDVREMVYGLKEGELNIIHRARTFIRPAYSKHELNCCLDAISRHIKVVAHRRLKYIADNDGSSDREDTISELTAHAVRLMRRYEVEAESYNHIIRLVVAGLQNHGINVAVGANRASRRLLQQVVTPPKFKTAWWFDDETLSIRKVEVAKKGKRIKSESDICCEVVLKVDGSIQYAEVARLHSTRKEALSARRRFRLGKEGDLKKKTLIDLNVDVQNDWTPTAVSIDKKIGRDSDSNQTIADIIPSMIRSTDDLDDEFVQVINRTSSQLIKDFTACIILSDPFFVSYLEEKKLNACTMSHKRLGLEACRFLGVKMTDVKKELTTVPQDAWTYNETREKIYSREKI